MILIDPSVVTNRLYFMFCFQLSQMHLNTLKKVRSLFTTPSSSCPIRLVCISQYKTLVWESLKKGSPISSSHFKIYNNQGRLTLLPPELNCMWHQSCASWWVEALNLQVPLEKEQHSILALISNKSTPLCQKGSKSLKLFPQRYALKIAY